MGFSGISPPDPFVVRDGVAGSQIWKSTNGLTSRTQVIDPAKKTLVLISAGQSQWTSIMPSQYTPTNSTVVDNFNIYDGGSYSIASYLLGPTQSPGSGSGNILPRIADLLINNGKFDRVILVPLAITGSLIAQWATGGALDDRITVAMRRLSSRGLMTTTTGITQAFLWGQGEGDGVAGTAQATYQTAFADVLAQATNNGFSGRAFVCKETWASGTTYATIQAAQVALVNGTTIFSGGDLDTLNATNRQADNTHFNDTGAAAVATLVYNAMHATGSPY